MAVVNYDIEYTKGDSHQIQVTDVGEIDRMYMTVKISNLVKIQKTYYADERAGTSQGIERQEDGSYIITLDPGDTNNLKIDTDYKYDIEIIVGKVKATIIKGKIRLTEEITCCRDEV